MQPYPQELRVRVVAAVEQGEHSIAEIARLFNVGVTFVKKMLRLHRAGDDLAPRQGGGPAPALKEPEHQVLRAHIAAQPDASLAELQQVLAARRAVAVSQATICRALQELGLPRKKEFLCPSTRRATKGALPPLNRSTGPRSVCVCGRNGLPASADAALGTGRTRSTGG